MVSCFELFCVSIVSFSHFRSFSVVAMNLRILPRINCRLFLCRCESHMACVCESAGKVKQHWTKLTRKSKIWCPLEMRQLSLMDGLQGTTFWAVGRNRWAQEVVRRNSSLAFSFAWRFVGRQFWECGGKAVHFWPRSVLWASRSGIWNWLEQRILLQVLEGVSSTYSGGSRV